MQHDAQEGDKNINGKMFCFDCVALSVQ